MGNKDDKQASFDFSLSSDTTSKSPTPFDSSGKVVRIVFSNKSGNNDSTSTQDEYAINKRILELAK